MTYTRENAVSVRLIFHNHLAPSQILGALDLFTGRGRDREWGPVVVETEMGGYDLRLTMSRETSEEEAVEDIRAALESHFLATDPRPGITVKATGDWVAKDLPNAPREYFIGIRYRIS